MTNPHDNQAETMPLESQLIKSRQEIEALRGNLAQTLGERDALQLIYGRMENENAQLRADIAVKDAILVDCEHELRTDARRNLWLRVYNAINPPTP